VGNPVQPVIQMLFPNKDAVFQDSIATFIWLELFSHDLKSLKVNIIFLGQRYHQI
jgi:hypothetical protein